MEVNDIVPGLMFLGTPISTLLKWRAAKIKLADLCWIIFSCVHLGVLRETFARVSIHRQVSY